MKIYCFSARTRTKIDEKELARLLNRVAQGTPTQDLVVALYLLPGAHQNRGTAYCQAWMTPANFLARRGKWTFTQKWSPPPDLPSRFKLIRMRLDPNNRLFPRTETDTYGWTFQYATFSDHLATLFAHELHHFRRYHLGLHPREGEHRANAWALRCVQTLGFRVTVRRLPRKRKPSFIRSLSVKRIAVFDPFGTFRNLQAGARLIVTHDPKRRYLGQTVTVLRPIRRNAKRIVVQTTDGKTWRWPMAWLRIAEGG